MIEQQEVYKNVSKRGYRKKWTVGQFILRNAWKMCEELFEFSLGLPGVHGGFNWLRSLEYTAGGCKDLFDNAQLNTVVIADTQHMKEELADMQVVLFCIASAIAEIDGENFDVVDAAVRKSQADIDRGVRQDHHSTK